MERRTNSAIKLIVSMTEKDYEFYRTNFIGRILIKRYADSFISASRRNWCVFLTKPSSIFRQNKTRKKSRIRLKAVVIGDSLKLNGVSKNNGGIEQFNGREGETSALLKTSLVKPKLAWWRFRPTSSQSLDCS